ncbi:Uncharacterised protein [uncultured Blautia sp.]|nr:Uncharacterised protein [uncultured Blautia sp.]
MFVQLAGVTDDQPIMAEQIGEGVHGDGVAAGIAVTQGRDGGPLTGLVGDKPVGAVGLFFQCHALPAVNMERVVVVEPDGVAHPLPGSDVDAREVVGVPVAVIVGIILREVLEVVHPDPPRLLQREAGVL